MSLTPEWDKIIELGEIVEELHMHLSNDHYKCDFDDDEDCYMDEADKHELIRRAGQAIAKAKGGERCN